MYNNNEVSNMKEHLTIKSHFDQLPLDVIVMSPSHPHGIIQFSHGMCCLLYTSLFITCKIIFSVKDKSG